VGGWEKKKKSKQEDIRDTTIASNEKEKSKEREREREREEMTLSSGPVHGLLSLFFSIAIPGDKNIPHNAHYHQHQIATKYSWGNYF
jgi:hypothetical protein